MQNLTINPEIANVPQTTQTKDVISLPENLTGKKLKKQSELVLSRINANKDYKSSEGSLSKMLKYVAEYGSEYIKQLNQKHGTNLTGDFLINSINNGSSSIFANFATDKEKAAAIKKGEQLGKNAPVYSFWVVLSFVSRYSEANKVKKQKETK